MSSPHLSVDRLRQEIELLGARGLPRDEYFAQLAPRLRRVIDNDASCWHTLDPHTRLMTSDAPAELVERGIFTAETATTAGELLVRSEYLVQDSNTFAELAARRIPVGTLDQATRGHPERSARYRDLLEPAGIPHELRAAFVIRGRVWGAVHIARRPQTGAFTRQDADALARVAGAIANGIRASLRFDAARRGSSTEAPGLVVVDATNTVELITPPARDLLDALGSTALAYADGALPATVLALASHVRDSAHRAGVQSNVVTVPSPSGWITLHASQPSAGDGRVAIVIEPRVRATVGDAAPRDQRGHRPRARGRNTPGQRPQQQRHRSDARALAAHGPGSHQEPVRKARASPRARNSSHACSSTSTSLRSRSAPRSRPPAASSSTRRTTTRRAGVNRVRWAEAVGGARRRRLRRPAR